MNLTSRRAGFQWIPLLTFACSLPALASSPGHFPLEFEENRGQANRSTLYLARTPDGAIGFSAREILLQSGSQNVVLTFPGANNAPRVAGEGPLEGVTNYLIGKDRSKWVEGAPHWARVRYADLYRGVDLLFRGGPDDLEYDFLVAPGADPSAIQLQFGANARAHVNSNGDLEVRAAGSRFLHHKPIVYQTISGVRTSIRGAYRAHGNRVEFDLGSYDHRVPLIIDPVLTFGAALIGSGSANLLKLAVDASGNAYIGGSAQALAFPLAGSIRVPPSANGIFRSADQAGTFTNLSAPPPGQIASIVPDPKTASLLYAVSSKGLFKSTNTGLTWTAITTIPNDSFNALAIDPKNSSVIYAGGGAAFYKTTDAGATWKIVVQSPVQAVAIDANNSSLVWAIPPQGPVYRSTDGFQTVVGLGVNSQNLSLALDPSNSSRVYVGRSGSGLYLTSDGTNFTDRFTGIAPNGAPVSVQAILVDPSNSQNVFVGTDGGLFHSNDATGTNSRIVGILGSVSILSLAFDSHTSSIVYAGTSGNGVFKSIDGGTTWKPAGPVNQDATSLAVTTQNVFTTIYANKDAFLSKLDPTGSKLIYSTYIGGSGSDEIDGLSIDSQGNAFACGATTSPDFPVRNALQPTYGGSSDAFVLRMNSAGSDFVFSTFLGGSGSDSCVGMNVDRGGNIYMTGSTFVPGADNNFPSVGGNPSTNHFGQDCFVAKLTPNAAAITFSLLLGGSSRDLCRDVGWDSSGNTYVAGLTFSSDFPIAPFGGTRLAPAVPLNGVTDLAFVAKFDSDGSLIYSQPFGGKTGTQNAGSGSQADSIVVNPATGEVYVCGVTFASDFPVTANAVGRQNLYYKGFVSRISADGGSFLYSTLLPGKASDQALGMAVDASGNAWVAGYAAPLNGVYFPVTADAADSRQRAQAGLLVEIDKTGSTELYGSYAGGFASSPSTYALGIANGPGGSVYVAGIGGSTDLPGTPTVFSPSPMFPPSSADQTATPDFVVYVERFDPVSASAPVISALVDGATFTTGPVAPGALVVMGGKAMTAGQPATFTNTLPTLLGGTSVKVNNTLAPLYYVSQTQVNFQVPSGTSPGSASVVVFSNGVASAPSTLTVAAIAPHIFIFGTNRAGLRNQDTSINTSANPASPASVVTVYFTGLGPVDNPVTDGQPAGSNPLSRSTQSLSATIGGQDAHVSFAGLTPQAIGLAQMNLNVPSLPPGDYPVIINVGGVASNAPLMTIGN